MIYAQTKICLRKSNKIILDFLIRTDPLISPRRVDLVLVKKKKKERRRICCIVDFAVSVDHKVKIK